MMPIGKKITIMENEEKISVVSEGLMSDKAAEKIGVLTATIVYDEEKIGVVSEGLMNDKAAEKIRVFGRGGGVRSRPSSVKFQISIFVFRNSSWLIESVWTRLVSTSLDMDNSRSAGLSQGVFLGLSPVQSVEFKKERKTRLDEPRNIYAHMLLLVLFCIVLTHYEILHQKSLFIRFVSCHV